MKMQFNQANIDNAGSLGVRRATVELNPVIASVLSRDLYKKPVESMFREILINAIDAGEEARQARGVRPPPVDIKLPTAWDETFHIRDYGLGLSVEQIMGEGGIYLDYGRSGRRHSDLLHGGLGLGTKSPLAYTTAFGVTSYQKGTADEYLVYYDQDNIPCVDHRGSEPTAEHDGLKVSLTTLSAHDWAQFHTAAMNILPRIPAEYYVLDKESGFGEVEPLPEGTRYGDLMLRRGTGMSIVMGFVAYQVDVSALMDYATTKRVTFELNGTTSVELAQCVQYLTGVNHIEVVSNIGGFQFHPSREHINITPRVVSELVKRLQVGLSLMLKDCEVVDITRNLLYSKLTGVVFPEFAELKIRTKLVTRAYGMASVPTQTNSYFELIQNIQQLREGAQIVLMVLSKDDFTDYLGKGRRSMQLPPQLRNENYMLFVDEESTEPSVLDTLKRTYRIVDVDDAVAEFRKERESTKRSNYNLGPRTVTRSMSSPKHNVLFYNSGTGRHKKDWESSKENVESLKGYKRPVFWAPTRMGCLGDPRHFDLMLEYSEARMMIPRWYRPIILGLPASKGTKTLERAFPDMDDFDAWLSLYYQSDYFKRRARLALLGEHARMHMTINRLIDGIRYGPISRLAHLYAVWYQKEFRVFVTSCNKASIFKRANLLEVDPRYASSMKEVKYWVSRIELQLPELTKKTWHNFNDSKTMQGWAQELADLTHLHPTSCQDIELKLKTAGAIT